MTSLNRLQTLAMGVPEMKRASPCKAASGDDIVIVSGARTPMTKARKGAMKDTACADMLAVCIKAAVERAGVKPADIDDVAVGNVGMDGAGALQGRLAMLLAGLPQESSVHSVNRQCSSGLQTIAHTAAAINAGFIKVGVAAGVESMTAGAKKGPPKIGDLSGRLGESQLVRDCLTPMGVTSENVAKAYGITREVQDKFALKSYQKALAAQQNGKFDKEITPITVKVKNAEGKTVKVTVSKDEGPRATTLEGLQKLKPSFAADGCSHAGNSSQTTDGAAAVIMCKRSTAAEKGLPVCILYYLSDRGSWLLFFSCFS